MIASFGYFVPQRIIDQFPLGMLNVHPSLLPQYRGASPLQQAILNGDSSTGVSIIDVDPNAIDHGMIVHRAPLQVRVLLGAPARATGATGLTRFAEH